MRWARTVWRGGAIANAATALNDALGARSATLAGRRVQRGGAQQQQRAAAKKKTSPKKAGKKKRKKRGGAPSSKSPVNRFLESRVSMWAPGETLSALGLDSLDEVQLRCVVFVSFVCSLPARP
jgi:hypothetical protein